MICFCFSVGLIIGCTVFDINRELSKLKREGRGNGGIFESWDSKSTLGRENLKKRLKNSIKCKQPYNNCVEKDGVFTYLPTALVRIVWFPGVVGNLPVTLKSTIS